MSLLNAFQKLKHYLRAYITVVTSVLKEWKDVGHLDSPFL